MKIKLFLTSLLALNLSTRPQQKIESHGDNNINVNGGATIFMIKPAEKAALTKKAKTLGFASEWESILLPANEVVLPSRCQQLLGGVAGSLLRNSSPPAKALVTARLGSEEIECISLPCNLIRTEKQELLWISQKNGVLQVWANVFDDTGKLIVQVQGNHTFVNWTNVSRRPIRDRSSLRVFNEHGDVALDLHLANKSTLFVEGSFSDGPKTALRIGKASIEGDTSVDGRPHHMSLQGNCSVENGENVGMSGMNFALGGAVLQP